MTAALVRDVMTPGVVAVRPDASLVERRKIRRAELGIGAPLSTGDHDDRDRDVHIEAAIHALDRLGLKEADAGGGNSRALLEQIAQIVAVQLDLHFREEFAGGRARRGATGSARAARSPALGRAAAAQWPWADLGRWS